MRNAYFKPLLFKAFRLPVAAFALLWPLAGAAPPASPQNARNSVASETREWARGAIHHAQKMRVHKDRDQGSQPTPLMISKLDIDDDPGGRIGTFQPGVATITANNAFFQNLGTNGRTCFTCHQPQTGWTISAADVRARFAASAGIDPIFRLVDGATCPTDNVSTLNAKRRAYKLLMDKGLIRIGLPMPSAPNLEFSVAVVDDPYGCTTNPATGLTSPTTGIMSMYRRPLPSTNLGFLTAIMWDGREPSLAQQCIDATLIHAQAAAAPTADQQKQIVDFETGIFTAQIFDDEAGSLRVHNATGGPIALSLQLSKFFVGVNDPV
jgi:cytochrome c peroxidase